jgi:hypothetical protein
MRVVLQITLDYPRLVHLGQLYLRSELLVDKPENGGYIWTTIHPVFFDNPSPKYPKPPKTPMKRWRDM